MKKIIILILFILCIIPFKINALSINSKSLYAMDIDSKREFYNTNANDVRLIASTTKIMTLLVALENSNPTDIVKVNNEILSMYGSNIYIEPNEEILMLDLLYGLMLRSGNDAAVAIAEHHGGLNNFVRLMNEKAKLLGLKNTSYLNPTGLDDYEKNYSTMKDLSYVYAEAYKNDLFKQIAKTNHYTTKSSKKSYDWYNRCKLVNMYDKQTGCKTGYTPDAGRVLVSSASNNDLNIVISSVNSIYDYDLHIKIYEEIFNKYKNIKLLNKEDFNKKYKENHLYIKNDFTYPLTTEEMSQINYEINLNNKNNQNIKIYLNDELIHEQKIFKKEIKTTFFKKIKTFINNLFD